MAHLYRHVLYLMGNLEDIRTPRVLLHQLVGSFDPRQYWSRVGRIKSEPMIWTVLMWFPACVQRQPDETFGVRRKKMRRCLNDKAASVPRPVLHNYVSGVVHDPSERKSIDGHRLGLIAGDPQSFHAHCESDNDSRNRAAARDLDFKFRVVGRAGSRHG